MKAKQLLILIFCSGLLISCNSVKTASGLYQSQNEFLKLNDDSTFSYKLSYPYFLALSSGVWSRLEENKIVLLSTFNPNKLPLDISNLDEKVLSVKPRISDDIDKDLFEHFSYRLMVNDSVYKMKFNDSVSLNIDTPVDTFQLIIDFDNKRVSGLRSNISSELISIDSVLKQGILVEFDLRDEMLSYEYFDSDTLMLTKNGVYWPSKQNRKLKRSK